MQVTAILDGVDVLIEHQVTPDMPEEENQLISSSVFRTFKEAFDVALTCPPLQTVPRRRTRGPRVHQHAPVTHSWSAMEDRNRHHYEIGDSRLGKQLIKHLSEEGTIFDSIKARIVKRTPQGNVYPNPTLSHHYAHLPTTPWYRASRDQWGKGGTGGDQDIPWIDYHHVYKISGRTTGHPRADRRLRTIQGNRDCEMHCLNGSGGAGSLGGYKCKGSPWSHLGLIPSGTCFPEDGNDVTIQICIDCYYDLRTHKDMCKYPWLFSNQPYVSFRELCRMIGADTLASKVGSIHQDYGWFPHDCPQLLGRSASWYVDKVRTRPNSARSGYEHGICKLRQCQCGRTTTCRCTEYEAPDNDGYCFWCKPPRLLYQETRHVSYQHGVARCSCVCPDCVGTRRQQMRAQAGQNQPTAA